MDAFENSRSTEVAAKLETGKQKKTDADAAFKAGDMKAGQSCAPSATIPPPPG